MNIIILGDWSQIKPVKLSSLFHKPRKNDSTMHSYGQKIYNMFNKCIIFDEIKRQQYITPDKSIHTDEEIELLQDQID